MARIDPKKGLHDLLAAAAELRRRGIPFELDLVGGVEPGSAGAAKPSSPLSRSAIDRLGLGGVVSLRGFLPAAGVRAALARAHLFVAPYVETARGDKDGIPTAILEAMATGLAVVATRSGSIPELITDGGNGRLVAAGLAGGARGGDRRAPGLGRRAGAARRRRPRARCASASTIEVCEPELARRLRALSTAARTNPAAG